MNRRLEISPLAERDIESAHAWYAAIRIDLAAAFREAVRDVLRKVVENPELYPVKRGDVRQVLVDRYPYAVSYLVQEDTVVVIACLHARRDPRLLEYRQKRSRS